MATLVSIIIPAYNEEKRIGPTLDSILQFLASARYRGDVVVVDDGSSDGTAAVVNDSVRRFVKAGHDLRLFTNVPNRGKGYSVRRGITEARGEVALFTDADLSSPIDEAPKLIEPIVSGNFDFAFGSRALDSSLIGVHQPFFREFGGRAFNLIMRLIVGLPFKDTQCGFKAFRRQSAIPVFRLQRIERFGFDPEILYIGRKLGLRLLEVPVAWNNSDATKVSFFKDSIRMFLDLFSIRLNDLRGRYSTPVAGRISDAVDTVQNSDG